MGSHNRITREKYNKIKQACNAPADDAKVMQKFGISQTTCRQIRNTEDYQEYCERVFRYHGHPVRRSRSASRNHPAPRNRPVQHKPVEKSMENKPVENKSVEKSAEKPGMASPHSGTSLVGTQRTDNRAMPSTIPSTTPPVQHSANARNKLPEGRIRRLEDKTTNQDILIRSLRSGLGLIQEEMVRIMGMRDDLRDRLDKIENRMISLRILFWILLVIVCAMVALIFVFLEWR